MPPPKRLAVIITALQLERKAVLAHLRDRREEPPVQGSIYTRGVFDENSLAWDVVVAEIGAGNEAAAAEAVRIITHYSPQVAIFVGVAGGIKDLKHGDVVASTKVYGFSSGKEDEGGFRTRPEVQLVGYALEQRARHEAGEETWLKRIKGTHKSATPPNAKVGPIAAGAVVVASAKSETFKFIREHYNDAIAVEMEGHGFLLGVRMSAPTLGIVVRGISDLVQGKDEAGDLEWQPIAASHAAAFAFQILAKLPADEIPAPQSTSAVQNAAVGDISGSNHTVIINQTQGTPTDELRRLIKTIAPDVTAQIETAVSKLKSGEPDIAIHILILIKNHKWDLASEREKYRVEANLGHAFERKGEFRKAAQHYLEAKRHLPLDEKARALEAAGYLLLGDNAKALTLAQEILKEHPNNSVATAVRIRTSPQAGFEDLEREVPPAIRDEEDVQHALAWRGLISGKLDLAERCCQAAVRLHPDSRDLKELLGLVIVQAESNARKVGKRVNIARVSKAVESLSPGIALGRGRVDTRQLRHARAEAYDLLGKGEEAEKDLRAATEFDKEDAYSARRLAVFLRKYGRLDAAVSAIEHLADYNHESQDRVLLAHLLAERNKTGDRESATNVLRNLVPELGRSDPEERVAALTALTYLLGTLDRHDEAIEVLDKLESGLLTLPTSKAIRAGVLNKAGQKEGARDAAFEGLQALGPESSETDRIRVAGALGFVGEKKAALGVWKTLLRPDHDPFFVGLAFDSAHQSGDDEYVLSFGKSLREAGVENLFALELEVMTREKYGMFDEAVGIMRDYIDSPHDDDLAKVFRVRMSLIGIRQSRPELIETELAKLPPVETAPVKIGATVAYVLKHGPRPEQGVKYAYELVRRLFNDPIARQAYVGVLGLGDEGHRHVPDPSTVEPGCAVKFKAEDGREKWHIIEDSPNPQLERNEIGPDHPWAVEMAGKGVGDTFVLRRDPIQNRVGTISLIWSKYAYRKVEILESSEDRFQDQSFVKKYTAPTLPDGTPDISLILKVVDIRQQQASMMHTFYREHPISATIFARLSETNLLKSLSHLASEGSLPVRCCLGNIEEMGRADAAFADSCAIVIDPSAIATLFFSDTCDHLEKLAGRCVVCESALEDYAELQQELAGPSRGFIGKHKGKYLFREDDPAERARQQERVAKFLTSIRPLVTMRTGEHLARVEPDIRDRLIEIFGQPTAEAIAEAAATDAILWTDDIAVAVVSKELLKVDKRVWTQHVFHHTASPEDCVELALFLLQWRYFFTRVEPEVVVAACKASSWDPESPPLSDAVKWLSTPELIDIGALRVCVLSLVSIWRQAAEPGHLERVVRSLLGSIRSRTNGRQLAKAVAANLQQAFEGERPLALRCKKMVDGILNDILRPAPKAAKSDWFRAIKAYRKRVAPPNGGHDTSRQQGSQPASPKARAEKRKKDRKRRKG